MSDVSTCVSQVVEMGVRREGSRVYEVVTHLWNGIFEKRQACSIHLSICTLGTFQCQGYGQSLLGC